MAILVLLVSLSLGYCLSFVLTVIIFLKVVLKSYMMCLAFKLTFVTVYDEYFCLGNQNFKVLKSLNMMISYLL